MRSVPEQAAAEQAHKARASERGAGGVTARALLLGLGLTAACDLWIHWAELVLGQRGHTALANTSIPVGAFNILFALAAVNLLIRRLLPRLAFSRGELTVIYTMMTVSTVISSSGGIHFVVPTITAAFWYSDSSNGWAHLFHRFIPGWLAQKSHFALRGFYEGNSHVPWDLWWRQMAAWCGFLTLYALATLCIVSLLRRLWIDRERLAFPTVALPLETLREPGSLFSNRLFWLGFALPFLVDLMNTIHLNVPMVPYLPTRTADQPDLATLLTAPPWNAIGPTPISIYPFVMGIAFLLSTETTFSCWFFWLMTKAEAIYGSASGWSTGTAPAGQSVWPFIGYQGVGAFLALTVVGLWLNRSYLKEVWRLALRGKGEDRAEGMSYRTALVCLAAILVLMVLWCMAAGMSALLAMALITLALLTTVAAARIRAETGDAWLFGPDVDTYHMLTSTWGSAVFSPANLTALAYVRNAVASSDMRCLTMPNQFDAYRIADGTGVSKRKLTGALVLALVVGIAVSFAISLVIWYRFGAGARTEPWRTSMGRMPFDQLASALSTPVRADRRGTLAACAGFVITAVLMLAHSRLPWWPLHPVGYAIANTPTMNQIWLPFFMAWLLKALVLRYGGIRLYRRSLPLAYGVIAGDFLAGGLTTLAGCFTGINVYPTNW